MTLRQRQINVEALEPRQLFSTIPSPAHVVVVIEENSAYNQIIGNSSAPYINSLAQQGALFTQSFAVTHPSQPNYLALFSGSIQGVTDDNGPISFPGPDLGSGLAAVGKSFAGYSEDLPSTGSQVLTSGAYARKHNPWSDFTDVPSSENMPFSSFPTNYNSLPTVSFVVPNLNDDMHDGTINQADQWLQSNLGGYVTWANTHNSVLIVTWDEDDDTSVNQIPTIMTGQPIVPGNYSETINHYNVLRTIEDMYGIQPIGASASASPITDVWQTTIAQSNTITGTTGVDHITLTQDSDHQHIDWTLGTTTAQLLISDAQGLTITGNGGTDQITLNYANGSPLPTKINLAGTFEINGLAASNPLAGVSLNINASTVYINYAGSASPLSAIKGYLQNGYNHGAWNGTPTTSTGVITSLAAQTNPTMNTAIGWVDAADKTGYNTLANTIELKYTLAGDTNLDGLVNMTDYNNLVAKYKLTPPSTGFAWDQGDFNYTGSVIFADLNLLAANYGQVLSAQVVPADLTASPVNAVISSPVPPPTSSSGTSSNDQTPSSTFVIDSDDDDRRNHNPRNRVRHQIHNDDRD